MVVRCLILLLLLTGCGPEIDYSVGWTRFVLVNGAEPPCDSPEVVKETRRLLHLEFTEQETNKIMQIVVYVYPPWDTVEPKYYPGCPKNGLYEEEDIHIRMLGDSLFNSAWLHEVVEHRAIDVVHGYPNAYHEEEWKELHQKLKAEKKYAPPRWCQTSTSS